MERKSIGKDAAIALHGTDWWLKKSPREIAEFQLLTEELCCPFDVFHAAVEAALGRPVWTHELALNYDGICHELFDGKEPPTFREIVELIPEYKRVVVLV